MTCPATSPVWSSPLSQLVNSVSISDDGSLIVAGTYFHDYQGYGGPIPFAVSAFKSSSPAPIWTWPLATTSEGAYWVAMFEGGRVLRIAPSGEILREILLPARCPTSIAFGGADLRTMYITTASHGRSAQELAEYPLSGKVLCTRVDVAGREEPEYRG